MKKIYLALITSLVLFFAVSCDSSLPFPDGDEIKRGVIIDLIRIPGSDGLLSDGSTDGDYRIKLAIPEQQGDYSFMSHAQVLAVLQQANGSYKTAVVVDNVTQFPLEITLNMGDVYSKLGLTAPSLGETLYLTTNAVLKDGYVVNGWTEESSFNNKAFTGWRLDGRAYSYNARYAVACGWDRDADTGSFVGEFLMTENSTYGGDSYTVTLSHNTSLPDPSDVPAGVNRENLYGVDITPISPNVWAPAYDVVTVWINPEDLSLVIPDQDTGDDYSNGMDILWYNFRDMSINTCTRTIQFTVQPYIPGLGGWSAFTFKVSPIE